MSRHAPVRLSVVLASLLWWSFAGWHSGFVQAAETVKGPESASGEIDAETLRFVTTKVMPLLESRCYECHGPNSSEPKADLRLDTLPNMLAGGDSGPAIEPGKPEESILIDAISWSGDYEMPPKSKMPDGEVAILTKWVKIGAPWPKSASSAKVSKTSFPLEERRANHWSWQAVKQCSPPSVKDTSWPRKSIDHFILRQLEENRLAPAPPTDRRTLLRRAYFDLIGFAAFSGRSRFFRRRSHADTCGF